MPIDAFLISILVGFARRGNLRNLAYIEIRYLYFLVVPMIVFGTVCALAIKGGNSALLPYVRWANIAQYACLVIGIALNVRLPEMRLALVGVFSNFLVIAANGGVMPMSAKALTTAGLGQFLQPGRAAHFTRYMIMTPATHLKPLADVIAIPLFPSLPPVLAAAVAQVVSIGDVLISVAVFILVQRYMCRKPADVSAEPSVAVAAE